ncbi:2-hydroxyacylsphingosine 1-beta-galactosyltransferase [Raphidocelis subcapitata]|uniref:2-hydroxyacylsphingosine 1-beta-galactosyltransferase n=1 Tax=Raphidocelis subcapitata TaxID=307507 RepID=A0A2V0P6T4_9CHLO|nr:2-hydroxyacylsphingosine 1-beta-galactosyltransferase [Raphidocelis subcapitata]|eukprot:GBF95279.1 2-hydroxyacylsphingosine 1-beta-galactosyltransferase [Raphidocelis subcapitata]
MARRGGAARPAAARSPPAAALLPLLLLLAAGPRPAAAYRVLFYPLGERTHMLVHLEVAGELAARGHAVHFLAPDCHRAFAEATLAARHPPEAAARFSYVPYPLDCEWVENDKKRAAVAGELHGIWMILEALANRTDALLSDGGTMAALRALRDDGAAGGIDLVVADPIAFGALLPAALGLPFVDFDVGTAGSLYEPLFYGAASAPAYIPAVGTFFPTNGMGMLRRAANLAATAGARAMLSAIYYHPSLWVQRMVVKHKLPIRRPYIGPLLHLVNSNFALEPPRPVAPITKYAGPVLPRPAAPLPAGLEDWVSGAGPLGTVLISFGGTLAAPAAASRAVLRAAALVPEARFLWKLSAPEAAALGPELAAAPGNLRVAEWLPQNDLLGHLRVTAFVTQGGFLSMSEAAYHGKPIIGVPLIAGQGELIRFAVDQGRGILLRKGVLTRGDAARFASAVRAAASDPSYAAAAALARERLRAARAPYRKEAADWIEYAAALRNHGSFLHTQGQVMRWWEVACLDVAAATLLLLALPVWWVYGIWAAGRAAAGEDPEAEDDLVQVTLSFPPAAQLAAKQMQLGLPHAGAPAPRQGGVTAAAAEEEGEKEAEAAAVAAAAAAAVAAGEAGKERAEVAAQLQARLRARRPLEEQRPGADEAVHAQGSPRTPKKLS